MCKQFKIPFIEADYNLYMIGKISGRNFNYDILINKNELFINEKRILSFLVAFWNKAHSFYVYLYIISIINVFHVTK